MTPHPRTYSDNVSHQRDPVNGLFVSRGRDPCTIYIKEIAITPTIDQWLAQLFDDEHLDDTCTALEAASARQRDDDSRLLAARRTLKACDNKFAKYRQALEAGTDATIVGDWIEEIKLEKKAAELHLRKRPLNLSKDDIRALVLQSKRFAEILAQTDPEDRRAVYHELGVSITYHRDGRLHVTAGPSSCTNDGVGGALVGRTTREAPLSLSFLVGAAS